MQANPQNIIAAQQISKRIGQNTINASSQADRVNPIDKKIQEILTPSNVKLSQNYIDQNFSAQQIKGYSLMNFLSKLYIQLFSQLLELSKKIDPKTSQPVKVNGQFLYQTLLGILSTKEKDAIAFRIGKMMQLFKTRQIYPVYCQMIVRAIIQYSNRLLQRANYSLAQSICMDVLLNQYCLKAQQTDSKSMELLQNRNIVNALLKAQNFKTAPNISLTTDKVLNKIIKQNFPQIKSQGQKTHWALIGIQDIIDPKTLLLERFHNQQNIFQTYLKAKIQQVNNRVQAMQAGVKKTYQKQQTN